ncbi:MAG: class I SAM-dependent methyltransferase [Buchananella hordeovulneris]|nr:class I SAM-dependent methyltransferase [Buchananella hordeovulneris]
MDKSQTWIYTEEFIGEDEAIAAGRASAHELGAPTISAGTGAALRLLVAASAARNVLEIGTGTGVGSLWLLAGMAADGVLTSIDPEAEFHKAAKKVLAAAGYPATRHRLICGQPLDVLPRMASRAYDAVIIDATAGDHAEHLDHARRLLRPGGLVCFVHALAGDTVADPARRDAQTVAARELGRHLRDDEDFLTTLLPVGDGLLAAVRR